MYGRGEVNGTPTKKQESPHHNADTFGFNNY
jgi:hypothetical protein